MARQCSPRLIDPTEERTGGKHPQSETFVQIIRHVRNLEKMNEEDEEMGIGDIHFIANNRTSNNDRMAPKNEGLVLRGRKKASFEPLPMPGELGPNDVLLRTIAVGICGSDMHFWKEGGMGTFQYEDGSMPPCVLGHETVSRVVRVGREVRRVQPGDRVFTDTFISCDLHCKMCYLGKQHVCSNIKLQAVPPFYGSMQKYFVYPEKHCFRLPETMTDEECAMVEPLSVGIYACRRAQVTVGDLVLVTGAGPIGLFTMAAALAFGAGKVVITDINENRLKLAREMGAHQALLVGKEESESELIKRIHEAFGGEAPDVTVECSGAGANYHLAVSVTRSAGTCVMVGIGPKDYPMPIADLILREINVLGAIRFNQVFSIAIEMISGRRVDLSKMVSHCFDFRDALKAFDVVESGKGCKVIIKFEDKDEE